MLGPQWPVAMVKWPRGWQTIGLVVRLEMFSWANCGICSERERGREGARERKREGECKKKGKRERGKECEAGRGDEKRGREFESLKEREGVIPDF